MPTDVEHPGAEEKEHLITVMEDVRFFHPFEMDKQGFAPKTFDFERKRDSIHIEVVQGHQEAAAYNGDFEILLAEIPNEKIVD